MFHKYIQKIKVARFFMNHGVYHIITRLRHQNTMSRGLYYQH